MATIDRTSIIGILGIKIQFFNLLGLENRGKTYTINKIREKNLDAGHNIHTEGLSVLLPELNEKFTFFDTAGVEKPIYFYKDFSQE